jgi:hypothetical protein
LVLTWLSTMIRRAAPKSNVIAFPVRDEPPKLKSIRCL